MMGKAGVGPVRTAFSVTIAIRSGQIVGAEGEALEKVTSREEIN
jgi:hypothetical protein